MKSISESTGFSSGIQQASDAMLDLAGSALGSGLSDGTRLRDESNGRVYLTLDGELHWVPDPDTYSSLFATWDGITTVPSINAQHIGEPLAIGARLVNGGTDGKVYLHSGQKRWITSPDVFKRFAFSSDHIQSLSSAELDALPTGRDIS